MAALVLGILALISSALILLIQWQNQVERRHGEIVQLKAQMISTLSDYRSRYASLLIHAETIRMELRRLPDYKGKFEAIEMIPSLVELLTTNKNGADEMLKRAESFNTAEANRTKYLLQLQNLAADVEKLGPVARQIEDRLIDSLAAIRSKIPT
jgi:hypothetical protein